MRCILVLISTASALLGCVERKETIVIRPDGAAEVRIVHASDDPDDLFGGDALPDAASGWEAQVREELDGEKTTYVFEATRSFAPGEALPSCHGPARDRLAAQYLQSPTTVAIEQRKDGTWYHFRRRYEPRAWAELKSLSESPEAKRLSESSPADDEPDAAQTERFARALVDLQSARLMLLARRAFIETAPRTPQDGWLRVREAMRRLSQELDAGIVVDDLMHATRLRDEGRKATAIQKCLRRIEDDVAQRLQLAVRSECGFGGSELSAFMAALAKHQRDAEVTQDVADDSFEIVVDLPGEVMGSNADTVAGGKATWRFKGESLMDQPRELMVSSRVGK